MTSDTQIRRKMIEELVKEVRGPRYGDDEIILFDPWIEYLTGVIIPSTWKDNESASSPEYEDINEIDDAISDEGSDDSIIGGSISNELTPKSMVKSFGISFSIESANPKFQICATWGRYLECLKNDVDAYDLKGNQKSVSDDDEIWKRYSFGEIFEIDFGDIDTDDSIKKEDDGNELCIIKSLKNFDTQKNADELDDDGFVKIYIKRLKISTDNYYFSIYMLNDLIDYNKRTQDFRPDIDKCLFQPSIRIICDEDIKPQHAELISESQKELDFLYREKRAVAFGHMCSAIWYDIDYLNKIDTDVLWPDYSINEQYERFLRPSVRTEFLPLYPVTLPKFNIDEKYNFSDDNLKAEKLANSSPNEIHTILYNLLSIYEDWIDENKSELDNTDDSYKDIADKLIDYEYNALARIKRGIDLIKKEDVVYTSFCFANMTMALQKSWDEKDKDDENKDSNDEEFKWRPFQIAFFIMNIEDMWNKNSKNRDILDLLWIPTGGGKTEAYLGLMAFTISLRRLKAYKKNETGAGTSIISRYTLRLLTVQQFRRTLKMITAAEYLRVCKTTNGIGWRPIYSECGGDWIYGSTRFSTGLWVGQAVSPIHLVKSGGAMDLLKGNDVNLGYAPGEPAQILKCPVCGSWLSVPSSGLNEEKNKLHIVIQTSENESEVENKLNEIFNNNSDPKNSNINFTTIESKNHEPGFNTVSFVITGKLSQNKFKEKIIDKLTENGYEIASLGDFNIGYFSSLKSIKKYNRDIGGDFDFEIWCTNPDCDLNNIEWYEGCPYPNSSRSDFPDGNYVRDISSPFKNNTRMPIPAYVIDDHVYNRCPTVIISTADKIARLAFEPKAAGIFGNVNNFNRYFGYNNNGLLPRDVEHTSRYNHVIDPLSPPDLIIQDELHLIDGPLGSLFGLYEAMVSGIIKKQNGNPKYIASTATISNASKQVDLLFSKKLFQFPPHGLDISNNFFVRDRDVEELWDESNAGRVYMGFYAPGKGPMTPQVRLWARMCKISSDNISDDNIENYWTTVGYFNSIKELGGVLALYRDDIKSRLENIGGNMEYKKLNEENKEELSSRNSSTELPIILDNLERDVSNSPPKYDGIFTTSMFGTGVDISHLSLMVMTSQPKTTGSYIQATGRIGREYGGLVVDFFKAGRPRDLNHYEMFSSFHSRIYLDVEPVSVSPFSQGSLSRGLGPSMVSFLRNSKELLADWQKNDGKSPIKDSRSESDFNDVRSLLKERLNFMKNIDDKLEKSILDTLEDKIKAWKDIAHNINKTDEKKLLKMNEYYVKKPKQNVVLGSEGHNYKEDLDVVYKNAPQSLRDVEETIDFWV